MAGLWQWHHDEQGYLQTFAIFTTPANAVLAPIHDRLPVIIDQGDALAMWLNPKTPIKDLRELTRPASGDALECRKVPILVNSVKNDGLELLSPS